MKCLALLLILLPYPAHAFEGTRGGGDDIGLEFQGELNAALAAIKASDPELEAQVGGLGLDALYASGGARALVVDDEQKLEIEGVLQNCVAVSDTVTLVTTITRIRWQALSSLRLKEGIALHEALVLKKVEASGQYPISGKFLARFGIAPGSLLSGDPQPPATPGTVLTVSCKPKSEWLAGNGPITELFLVFDGNRGLEDPALAVIYRHNPTLPGRNDSFAAELDSDTPGKITYRIGDSLNGVWFSGSVAIDSLTFDFPALVLGTVGHGVAVEHSESTRGFHSSPHKHDLTCKITNTPPKG